MRTTLSLDDDVAVFLEKIRKAKGLPLKEIVGFLLQDQDQPAILRAA